MKSHIVKFIIALCSFYIKAVSLFSGKQAANIAMGFFKRPRNKKLYPKHINWLESYKIGYIELDHSKCAIYHIPGEGKNILLAHGWESNSYRWKKYVDPLKKLGFNIFMIDAPGHGLSIGKDFTPPEYGEAINQACHEKNIQIIIGHSAGGYSALFSVGRLSPAESLEQLILLAPTNKLGILMQKFYDVLSLNGKTRNWLQKIFIQTYGHSYEHFNGDSMIKDSKLEGIIVHDKDDDVLPIEYSHELEKAWEGGQLITTEGFGHRLLGPEILRIVIDYLKHGKTTIAKI